MPSPDALDYDCHECGKRTKVNMRTGLMYVHNMPGTRTRCSESNAAVVDPDPTLPPPRYSSGNPTTVPYRCPCGADTKANRRTGRLYSHCLPGTTEVCPESDSVVVEPEGGQVVQPPPLRKPRSPAPAPRVAPGPSTSVWAHSAGLPGGGRRRTR